MQSVLDIIINPKGAMAGAQQVNQSLNRIKQQANETTNVMRDKFNSVRQTLFSVQTAIVGLGFGAFAKSLIDVTRNLNMAERQMRGVTTSTGQAALELENVRRIADKFMFADLPMAHAFRLLASHDIPNVEQALDTLGNAALATGRDIESVTNAILSGNERQLRQLGVRIVDLGTGQVDLIFGKMELRANKTDQAIRNGLLKLLKEMPDATKQMGNDMDFQIRRLEDAWEDFRIAIMRGGLEDFLTATFREIADGFDENAMKRKGQAVAEGIQEVIKAVAKDVAFVLDLVAPLASILGDIFGSALRMFGALPPMVQTIGIFGVLFFGLRGLAVMTAGLALAEAMGIKAEQIGKGADMAATGLMNSAQSSPLGLLMRKGAELATGKNLTTRPKQLDEQTYYIGLGESIKSVDELIKKKGETTTSYAERVEKFFNRVSESSKKIAEERKKAEAQAKAERAAGATGLSGGGLSDDARKINAQLARLKADTAEFTAMEERKRSLMFSPDQAEQMAKAVEFINKMRQDGLPIEARHEAAIKAQFALRGEAIAQTKIWTALEEDRIEKIEAGNRLMDQATIELQEAIDASRVMEQSIENRSLETAKLAFQRELMSGKVQLERDQKDEILAKLVLIDRERKMVEGLQMMEARRLELAEETARLNAETRDMMGRGIAGRPIGGFPGATGQTNQSRQTLLEEREREFANRGLSEQFNRSQAELEIDNKLRAQRQNFIARENYGIQQQINQTSILVDTMGMTTDERQKEIRLRETILSLQQRGVALTSEEVEEFRKQQDALQEAIAGERTAQAMNSFVDNFRVGWDTIIKSGEQAYQHLEDALTQMIMTGKADFTSFANFVQQELIRMGIRASMNALMGQLAGGGGGGFNFGDLLSQGISAGFGAMKGPGFGTANSLGAGSGNLAPTASNFAQRGGVFDWYGRIPGFQHGGVNHHERLIKISEGQTPEAIIPLSGGRNVPVKLTGADRGVTINAPITFVTPDAQGARRSQTQIQAQMSTAMSRASRRIQ